MSSASAWLRWCVIDEARRRPRALVRLVLHAIAVLLGYLASALLVWAAGGVTCARAAGIGLQTAAVIGATWAAARWLDGRDPRSLLGPFDGRALRELALGAMLGAGLIAIVAGAETQLGGARYASIAVTGASASRALAAILFFVAVAIDEELWFRAYQLTNLAESLSGWLGERASRGAALVLTSLSFGLAHALNPNADLLSTANIAFGGVLLGVSYAITSRLWIALGLHFAWNTAQCFLDMPVSGQTLYDGLFVERVEAGEDLVTGGAFGPEGGLLGLGAMAVGTVLCVIHGVLAERSERSKLARSPGS